MKKLKIFCKILVAFVFFSFVYSGWVVISAKSQTDKILQDAFEFYGESISVEDLNERQREILLGVEDPNFFHHNGMDITTNGAGLTTITQAMVKYLYFDKFEKGFGKIKQTLIAVFVLDKALSKKDQLSLFLNSARFGLGGDLYGFQNAAHVLFAKDFKQLSNDEFINLTARLIQPSFYQKPENKPALEKRIKRIKNLLAGHCSAQGNTDVFYNFCD